MPYVDLPLTEEVRDAVSQTWGIDASIGGDRLVGGEESAAFRVGEHVVRVGPAWRATAELEWCHRIALAAAEELSEAVAPLPMLSGDTVVRVGGHPISVWPLVEGSWVDKSDDHQREQAAELLARLHRALATHHFEERPRGTGTVTTQPVGDDDPELDRWVRGFDAAATSTQAVHGDFYAANMLARDGRIVALLDWDEALLSPPTRELAWAAWEFGDGLWADDLDQVWSFITAYRDASGPAEPPDDLTLRMLVRQRLLGEMRYVYQQSSNTELADEDRAYRRRQIDVYDQLAA